MDGVCRFGQFDSSVEFNNLGFFCVRVSSNLRFYRGDELDLKTDSHKTVYSVGSFGVKDCGVAH